MGLPAPNQFKNERTNIQYSYIESIGYTSWHRKLADLYPVIGVLPNPVGPDLRELSC
jgi:hypothetical protein